ncbi:MAG TPA: hypothetical protein VN328_08860 [Thermodesulfovibrionales bacterium]|nr:hypothetical protein [Thermodesulfovibrionales bacterium]
MKPAMINWCCAPDFDLTRRSLLEKTLAFEDIISLIESDAQIVGFDVCPGKHGHLKKCLRPEFQLDVHMDTFDIFFNGAGGYRMQYLSDPDEGQKQNSHLLLHLSDKLLAYANGKHTKYSMSKERIAQSLRCCSAKIWIGEGIVQFNHELIVHLTVSEWHRHALAAIEAYFSNRYPSPLAQEKAIWGIRAPQGTRLEIKGAFLDEDGYEVVPFDKIERRFEIHYYGYA